MKLYLVLFAVLFTSCNLEKNNLKGVWIGHYYPVPNSSPETRGITTIRTILEIREDSILFNKIPEFPHENFSILSSGSYTFQNNYLKIFNTKSIDSIFISENNKDSLVIDYGDVYKPLVEYNQLFKKNEIFEFLTKNIFFEEIEGGNFEFSEDGSFVYSNLERWHSSYNFWGIHEYKNELFLIINDYNGAILHLKDFDQQKLTGILYDLTPKEVTFRKVIPEIKNDIKKLSGLWEELSAKPTPRPPYVEGDFYDKTILEISDTKIYLFEGFLKDTLAWKINKGNDIIILPECNSKQIRLHGKQWNILELTDEKLIIEKISPNWGGLGNMKKVVNFKRK